MTMHVVKKDINYFLFSSKMQKKIVHAIFAIFAIKLTQTHLRAVKYRNQIKLKTHS
jgi:hypothetical protein